MRRALLHRRPARGRWRLHGLLALSLAAAIAWSVGFVGFVDNVPRAGLEVNNAGAPTHSDAIVVLTGGSGRLAAGLALLESGQAQKLFVSGVYHGVDVAALLRLSQTAPRDLDCCITLGYSADDTTGNATETAQWMLSQGFDSLILVTANYHLSRSLLEFRSAMPNVEIVAWPVYPPKVQVDSWWRWPGTAKLLAGEYTKYLAARLRIWLRSWRDGERPNWLS